MRTKTSPTVRMYVSPDPKASYEYELIETLKQIWGNRNCITSKDLETLKLFANKGLYEEII